MEPHIGKIALNTALFLIIIGSFSLLFVRIGSAEFVVSIIALCISFLFLGVVIWDIRRQARKHTSLV